MVTCISIVLLAAGAARPASLALLPFHDCDVTVACFLIDKRILLMAKLSETALTMRTEQARYRKGLYLRDHISFRAYVVLLHLFK